MLCSVEGPVPRALEHEAFFDGLITCFVTLQGPQRIVDVAMGKRYFCDYCDRSFQDNLHNRKKHLNGLQHLKAKKVWYDMFRGVCSRAWRPAPEACTPAFPLSHKDHLRDSLGWTGFLAFIFILCL